MTISDDYLPRRNTSHTEILTLESATTRQKGGPARGTDVLLLSADIGGGLWLFQAIEIALWLLRSAPRARDGSARDRSATILFLPVRHTPVRTLIRRLVGGAPGPLRRASARLLRRILSVRTRSYGSTRRRLEALLRLLSEDKARRTSLYHRVASGESVEFRHGGTRFVIQKRRAGVVAESLRWFVALHEAWLMWRRCFVDGAFVPARFLSLECRGVRIGDLAGSTALSEYAELGGSLKPEYSLLKTLARAIYVCNVCDHLDLHRPESAYAVSPEETYIHSVYTRRLHQSGVSVVNCNYRENIFVERPGAPHVHPGMAEPARGTHVDREAVAAHLEGRLYNAEAHIWYMRYGANDNRSAKILAADGRPFAVCTSAFVVIVFLHCFGDAQYAFGVDGLDDIFHWARFTIDHCLSNARIDQVLVKPHPNEYGFPSEQVALARLAEIYRDVDRVTFVERTSSLVHLMQDRKCVGITHHGSVAEEVVFLNQPVIGSAFAPWGTEYPFLRVWSTVDEYRQMLAALSAESWSPPSLGEIDMLYRYVQEIRLGAIPPESGEERWVKLARLLGEGTEEVTLENHVACSRRLEAIEVDTPLLHSVMAVLDGEAIPV